MELRPMPSVAGSCPRCDRSLHVARLHMPGWRALVEGRCEGCGHWYVQDAPSGHGLLYPATLDLDTGETFDPFGAPWFSSWLARSWAAPRDAAVELAVEGPGAARPAVLLNCIDPVYGHSLLKLLNAQRHLEEGDRDVVVMVPRALTHLVPDGVAETWTLEGPPSRGWEWMLRLDERLQRELDRLGDCVLSPAFPHPHPSTWDLETFTGDVLPERRGEPSFTFAFRGDRPWGLTAAHQDANLRRLWRHLSKRFPDAGGSLIGVGSPGRAPSGVDDLRVERPGLDDERRWLAAARGADIVIGMHGSHLLLPSGLAKLTLELTPADRHSNVLQATLVTEPDPVLALWCYRQILGGAHLANVTPARVAGIASEMVSGRGRFTSLMAGSLAGVGGPVPPGLPSASATRRWPRALAAANARMRSASGRVVHSARARRAALGAPTPPVVLTDRRGLRFELETPEEVAAFRTWGGHFEAAELDFLAGRPLEGVAIDVGANIGAFSAVLARAIGPIGHLHSFEPMDVNIRRLRRTLELNGLANVTIHQAAVSDAEGTANLASYGPGYESWASLTRGEVALDSGSLKPLEQLETPVVTLDAFCQREGIERVAALKVDVEGAEGRVLSGAARLLSERRVDLLVMELSDNTLGSDGWTSGAVVRLLRDHGYDTWVVEQGELRPFRSAGRVDFANLVATPAA
jgi:FkbM family methyltransferase